MLLHIMYKTLLFIKTFLILSNIGSSEFFNIPGIVNDKKRLTNTTTNAINIYNFIYYNSENIFL